MFNSDMTFNDLIEKYVDYNNEHFIDEQFVDIGTLIYQIGKPISKIYFCKKTGSGIVRAYIPDEESDEGRTTGFWSENEPVVPIISLIRDVPVAANFQVIEAGWFYVITKKNAQKIKELEPNWRDILFRMVADELERHNEYLLNNSETTLDRYKMLVEKYPYLDRVPDKYKASYLAVYRTTISRSKTDSHKKKRKPKK